MSKQYAIGGVFGATFVNYNEDRDYSISNSYVSSFRNALAANNLVVVAPSISTATFVMIWPAQTLTPKLFANTFTQLLLHFDGDLSDSSGNAHAIATAGGAALDAQNVLAGQSLKLSSASDYISTSDIEIGTEDFCIELRARLTSAGTTQVFYNGGSNGPVISYDGAALKFESVAGTITGSTALAANTNYHVAATRAGGLTRLWLNGVQQGATLSDPTNYKSTVVRIGGLPTPLQTLTPTLYANTQSFFNQVLTGGASLQTLTPTLYANAQGFLNHVVTGGSVAPSFVARGVQFDGYTDYFVNRGNFGLVDSPRGTLSMWLNIPADPGQTFLYLFGWQAGDFNSSGFLIRNLNTFMQLLLYKTGGQIATISPNSGFGSPAGLPPDTTSRTWRGAGWRWLGFSWDLPAGRMQCASNMYVTGGDVDWFDGSSISDASANVQYDPTGFPCIGSYGFLQSPYIGGLAEFMFWGGTSLDLYDTATMRKLITATGHPADVGSDGSAVTGFLPTWYFKGPAAGFGINATGKGNMIIEQGSGVTDSPTDP